MKDDRWPATGLSLEPIATILFLVGGAGAIFFGAWALGMVWLARRETGDRRDVS
jgi:hypothetical protein